MKGFVFGKFLPFHKGHEAMIRFALQRCDFVTALVCASDKEPVNSATRARWINETFADSNRFDVLTFDYNESELPNTSVSSVEVSAKWAAQFKRLFPDYEAVITSEPYGEYVANFMNIKHIAFDIERNIYPVSAGAIRKNLGAYWHFLPPAVKCDYAVKVVLLGTESTGKTTLTQRLARHYNCKFVLEAGRDIIANSNNFEYSDLITVAHKHAEKIHEAIIGDSPIIIVDTDVHITMSYSQFAFQKELAVSDEIIRLNHAALYLYLNSDAPYIQDGTRLSQTERNLLDLSHRKTLEQHGVPYVEISGSWDERFNKSVEHISEILKQYNIA